MTEKQTQDIVKKIKDGIFFCEASAKNDEKEARAAEAKGNIFKARALYERSEHYLGQAKGLNVALDIIEGRV